MSEHPHVHAPQQGIHSWRDFSVHIAVVTIGLLLAIGLQQVVEAVHHRSQRAHLEEQMHETLVANSKLIEVNLKTLAAMRSYLVDIRFAVDARIGGRTAPAPPVESDPRNFNYAPPPDLGAYEAAKANGTVALLGLDRIRLYDRIVVSNEMMFVDFRGFLATIGALRKFRLRFETAPASRYQLSNLDLAKLSNADLYEYRTLLGDMLGTLDGYTTRLRNRDVQSRAIVAGAQSEDELRGAMVKPLAGEPGGPEPAP